MDKTANANAHFKFESLERKVAELEKEREFYKSVIDSLNAAVRVILPDGSVEYSTDGFPNVKRSIAAPATSYFAPFESESIPDEVFRHFSDGGEPISHEFKLSDNGGYRYYTCSATPVFDKFGNVDKVALLSTDVTPLKTALNLLHKNENKFRTIATLANDAIVMLDEHDRIEFWSRSAKRIFGIHHEEAVGKFLYNLIFPPDSMEVIARFINEFKLEPTSLETDHVREVLAVKSTGETFPVEISINFFDEERKVGSVCVIRDISWRKRAERDLIEALRIAEDANRMKEKFLTLVSHDLKSPLGSIFTMLNMLAGSFSGIPEAKKQECIATTANTCKNLIETVDTLLDMSRLKSGDMVVSHKRINLASMANSTIQRQLIAAGNKSVELINEVPEDAVMFADPALMAEVLGNLVSNSVKFCNAGDKITIYVPENSENAVAVRDTGVGMPPEIAEHVFLHDKTTSLKGTDGEKGTGFGLPFCHEIVKTHHGRIKLDSTPGTGTAISIHLPKIRGMVLLVDDNPMARKAAKNMLDSMNFCVIEAENGRDAIELLVENQPEMIITDLKMPVMGGFDMIREIRSQSNYQSLPILVMTSYREPHLRDHAFEAGATDFMDKHIFPSEFVKRIAGFFP